MKDMDGKVSIVTGADNDLGEACAMALTRKGLPVVLAGGSVDKLKEAEAAINGAGGRAAVFEGDLSDPAIVERLLEFAGKEFGVPVILVNVPGSGIEKAGEWPGADMDRYYHCCSKAAEVMAGAGKVLLLTWCRSGVSGDVPVIRYRAPPWGELWLYPVSYRRKTLRGESG